MPNTERPAARRRRRWVAPLVAAAVVAAATAAPGLARDTGPPDLPAVAPLTLLARMARPNVAGIIGTATLTTNLGLPELPASDLAGSPLQLLTGSHTLQVWISRRGQFRVAVLRQFAEQDLIHDAGRTWLYDSTVNAAAAVPGLNGLGALLGGTPAGNRGRGGSLSRFLTAAAGHSRLGVAPPVRVAGRPCYQLALTDDVPDALIRQLRVAVDATTGVPLRLQVFGTSTVPALDLTFTSVRFTAPAPGEFTFTRPQSTRLESLRALLGGSGQVEGGGPAAGQPVPQPSHLLRRQVGAPMPPPQPPQIQPTQQRPVGVHVDLGQGWDAVLEVTGLDVGPATSSTLDQLSTPVPAGLLFSTDLLSVLTTPDGRLLVGAVAGARLEQLAAPR